MKHHLYAAAILVATSLPGARGAGAAPDARLPAETEAAIKAIERSDLASSINATVDDAGANLSAQAFRAIQAIERYRRRVQWKGLTVAERDFDNFSISVSPRDQSTWLKADEKAICFQIVLWPRRLPGEQVLLDVPAKLGRSAVYAVRRSDARVMRAQLDDRRRW